MIEVQSDSTKIVGDTVEVTEGLIEATVSTNDSAYMEVMPAEYTLSSGGIFAGGNLTGAIPTWVTAAIVQEIQAGGSIATLISGITTLTDQLAVGIQQNIDSINTSNTSINTIVNTVVSEVGSNRAIDIALIATKVTEAEATAIALEQIGAKFGGDVEAYKTSITTAFANRDTAYANDYDIVVATLNGTSASVTRIDEAVVDTVGGARAKSSLVVDVGGHVAGFVAEATGLTSSFNILADKFTVSNGVASTPPMFSVDTVTGKANFNGVVTFGGGSIGTVDEAIAASITTIAVGDKNINITDNLIPTTSLIADTNNAGYQLVGAPVQSSAAGIDVFAEPQINMPVVADEVYSPYVDEMYMSYYYRFAVKGVTSLDRFNVVLMDSLDAVTYNNITYTMIDGNVLDATTWYSVEGIINPTGGNIDASGAIRLADGTKVGTVNNYVMASTATKMMLGWIGVSTISRMKLAKITADTLTGSFATTDYVNTTTIDGGRITTGTIDAQSINTVGLIAESISATIIHGKEITGSIISGAAINGAVIKASYLDLDGELEVLTNFHIPVTTYNANPSLYSDAVYLSATHEYRLPSISSVSDITASSTRTTTGTLISSYIGSYDRSNSGNNNKAVRIRPPITVAANIIVISAYAYASYCNRVAYTDTEFLLGDTVIFTHRIQDNADCGGGSSNNFTGLIFNNFGTNVTAQYTSSIYGQWTSFTSCGLNFNIQHTTSSSKVSVVRLLAGDYPNIATDISGNSPLLSTRVSTTYETVGGGSHSSTGSTSSSVYVNNLR